MEKLAVDLTSFLMCYNRNMLEINEEYWRSMMPWTILPNLF
ncbi:hypothetical protein STRCR_2337 [Streptococcus criceti HS-6]|uniref:Uncharacterized protein n=1 Tax=Streptococcus criceti HS-6 TaxID=873449 RepID=G5JTE7_STRCG|nr:hypothetical protein STRCR_2337 [Streptococcus criceti HS-6]